MSVATFTFDLPSAAGCMARPCGEGHRCFLRLTDAAKQKSADGSGVLIGTITDVTKLNLTSWRYVVEVADSEFLTAPSANEMQLLLSCIGPEADALLLKIGQAGSNSERVDVWEPHPPYYGEAVPIGLDRWVGTVPRPFAASHLRLSCGSNNGVSLDYNLQIGSDFVVLAQGSWAYQAGVYSLLVPFSAWDTGLTSNVLPAGAQINLNTEVSGAYPAVMGGLQIAFLGRWLP